MPLPAWIQKLWDDIRPSIIWALLAGLFGGGLVTGGVPIFMDSPITLTVGLVIFIVSFIGLAVLAIIFMRGRKSAEGRARRMESKLVLVYLPIAIGLVFCVWAYMVSRKVFQMSDDVRRLKVQAMRYVLPRTITPEQFAKISEYLSQQSPQQVVLEYVQWDEEVGDYRGQIQQALERGGWVVAENKPVSELPDGVRINVVEPVTDVPESPFDRLKPKPKMGEILVEALQRGGVRLEGSGIGAQRGLAAPIITISIGRRRRDKWGVQPPNMEQLRRHPMPPDYPTDDDF